MRRSISIGWLALACAPGAQRASGPPPVIEVPRADGTVAPSGPMPPRAEPVPAPPRDPLDDYVGIWDGSVNGTVSTELVIEHGGRFRVKAPATSWRPECDLSGRFRASDRVVWMDVERSSCSVVAVGSTLERAVLSKSERQFTVESEDGSLVIRYTRRAE
jgi:hypothetical protein